MAINCYEDAIEVFARKCAIKAWEDGGYQKNYDYENSDYPSTNVIEEFRERYNPNEIIEEEFVKEYCKETQKIIERIKRP